VDRFSIILNKPKPQPKKRVVKKRRPKEKPVEEKDELMERLAFAVSLLEQEVAHRGEKLFDPKQSPFKGIRLKGPKPIRRRK
jgi:hypothetical protein